MFITLLVCLFFISLIQCGHYFTLEFFDSLTIYVVTFFSIYLSLNHSTIIIYVFIFFRIYQSLHHDCLCSYSSVFINHSTMTICVQILQYKISLHHDYLCSHILQYFLTTLHDYLFNHILQYLPSTPPWVGSKARWILSFLPLYWLPYQV